jgi:hypothetical protein
MVDLRPATLPLDSLVVKYFDNPLFSLSLKTLCKKLGITLGRVVLVGVTKKVLTFYNRIQKIPGPSNDWYTDWARQRHLHLYPPRDFVSRPNPLYGLIQWLIFWYNSRKASN